MVPEKPLYHSLLCNSEEKKSEYKETPGRNAMMAKCLEDAVAACVLKW